MRAPPSQRPHFLIPSPWIWGFQHTNLEGHRLSVPKANEWVAYACLQLQ
jgi:hypothetical protein